MKYHIGDIVYFNNGVRYKSCIIKSILEKTKRYRVEVDGLSERKPDEYVIKESQLFESILDGIESEIKELEKEKGVWEYKLVLLKQKKYDTIKG